jgi:phosphoenolpyruvate synthase/pyruvate phosphate dikinase
MTKEYKVSDEDIEGALRYMKLHISKDATWDDAKEWLEEKGSNLHKLAISDPEKFIELKRKIDNRKRP